MKACSKIFLLLVFSLFLVACSHQKASLSQREESIEISPQEETPSAPSKNAIQPQEAGGDESETPAKAYRLFTTAELGDIDAHLAFRAMIPQTWQAEYIPEISAIAFYEVASGVSDGQKQRRDTAQIFVRYFVASDFLTLKTVTIHSRLPHEVNGKKAVLYDIQKKPDAATFPYQPQWRNERHFVTDIRENNNSPTTFFVFAKRPDLNGYVFDDFIDSVRFGEDAVYFPMSRFEDRVTKKPFGIFIDPQTSPIQLERFRGFHTGVDGEVFPEEVLSAVPVYAVTVGKILAKKEVDGYGGVVVVSHTFHGNPYTAIYGHVKLSSVQHAVGDTLKAGEVIAVLGEGGTAETDGERKHLHFALVPGAYENIAGYVSTREELSKWGDPMQVLKEHYAEEVVQDRQ